MIVHQLRLPICKRCGKLHNHFLEYTYSSLCPVCHGQWIVETFAMSAVARRMTDTEALDYLQQRRPELFQSGTLPDYWSEVKANLPS